MLGGYSVIAGEKGGYAKVINEGLGVTKLGFANFDGGVSALSTSYSTAPTTPAATLETLSLYSSAARVFVKLNGSTKELSCPAGVWTHIPVQVSSFLAKSTAGTPALTWHGYY